LLSLCYVTIFTVEEDIERERERERERENSICLGSFQCLISGHSALLTSITSKTELTFPAQYGVTFTFQVCTGWKFTQAVASVISYVAPP